MWIYPLLVLAASCSLAAAQRDPQDDLDDLVIAVRASERGFYREGGANIGVFTGRGWTLTMYVGDTRRYGPGTFLVLTKLDGQLGGELLTMPAADSGAILGQALAGPDLDLYLRRTGLDLTGLEAALQARVDRDPAPPAPKR